MLLVWQVTNLLAKDVSYGEWRHGSNLPQLAPAVYFLCLHLLCGLSVSEHLLYKIL